MWWEASEIFVDSAAFSLSSGSHLNYMPRKMFVINDNQCPAYLELDSQDIDTLQALLFITAALIWFTFSPLKRLLCDVLLF